MRYLSSLIVPVASFFMITSAFAKEVVFKFDVISSGAEIYACNAGLAHQDSRLKICHIAGSETEHNPFGTACRPTCATTYCDSNQYLFPNAPEANNCVCTGSNGGNFLVDYMKYTLKNNSTPYTKSAFTFSSRPSDWYWANKTWFNSVVNSDDNKSIWTTQLDTLTFNLGSERYGADYYVDICYKGPQIPYFKDGVNTTYLFNGMVSATDLQSGSKSYAKLAQPKVVVMVKCDLQDGNDSTVLDQLPSNNIGIDDVDYTFNTPPSANNWFNFSPGFSNTEYKSTIVGWQPTAPRFCVVRYLISEGNAHNERKWQRHDATFCTNTSIEEGLE